MKELKEIPKTNPFRVPDNYFEEIEGRILAATTGTEEAPIRYGIFRRLIPYAAVAASVALLAIVGYSVFFNGSEVNGVDRIPEISVNEFTDTYLNDIDLLTLENKVAESTFLFERTGANRNDIIEYLVNENIDISVIYENL
jgi:hypothetical protein